MWPIVTARVAWSVVPTVCRSVTLVSPAKTDEPTEMPSGMRTRVGPGNHLLSRGSRSHHGKGQFRRAKGACHCEVYGHSAVICAKTAEPIDMPFGLWTRVGRRKHKFNRIRQMAPMCPHSRVHLCHLANTIEQFVNGGNAALCQITLTAC